MGLKKNIRIWIVLMYTGQRGELRNERLLAVEEGSSSMNLLSRLSILLNKMSCHLGQMTLNNTYKQTFKIRRKNA